MNPSLQEGPEIPIVDDDEGVDDEEDNNSFHGISTGWFDEIGESRLDASRLIES